MNKPKKTMMIKMSAEDVADAVELWMDKYQKPERRNLVVQKVEKTSSKIYFLTAFVE